MAEIFGVENMADLDLFRKLKIAANLMSHLIGEHPPGKSHLSSARMRLLIWLVVNKKCRSESGLLPSELSRHLSVSRNTVSALINGLEKQGLIERQIHPEDRRQMLIRITPTGEHIVAERAPKFAIFVHGLFEALTIEDREQLLTLLDKVIESMHHHAAQKGLHPPAYNTDLHQTD